jgi:LPXTG-site transpeptidase (sortase) family protein
LTTKTTTLAFLSIILAIFLLVTPASAAENDIRLISADTSGNLGSESSTQSVVTSDGGYVAFTSLSPQLTYPSTILRVTHIFRRQVSTGETRLVSVSTAGSEGLLDSQNPSISDDGRYIAFESKSSNLSAISDTNGTTDVFVRDMVSNTTRVISVNTTNTDTANAYSLLPSISADGNYIAFESPATNLMSGISGRPYHVYLYNGTTMELVSVSTAGVKGNGKSANASISDNGSLIAFDSSSNNLVAGDINSTKEDIFVRNRTAGTTTLISIATDGTQGNDKSVEPSISSDGRYVAFSSIATNLVSGDTNAVSDVFVHDRQTGETNRVSVSSEGEQDNGISENPSISPDGRYVSFDSDATNLVPNDTNGVRDVFLHDRNTGMTTRLSMSSSGVQGGSASQSGTLSLNAAYASFVSSANLLTSPGSSITQQIFLKEPDRTVPSINFTSGSVPASSGAVINTRPSTLTVQFSESMLADGSSEAVDSIDNYLLVQPGTNGTIDTTTSSSGICDSKHVVDGDDERIDINSISYNSSTHLATLSFKAENTPLAEGRYELFICGTASIHDLVGNLLNAKANTGVLFTVGGSGSSGSGSSSGGENEKAASIYPATGFAPDRVTKLSKQTTNYSAISDMQLDIPVLGVRMPVVEVPRGKNSWDVSWLGGNAGWLEGSAFPTWEGNSVLTGHVFDANGQPGPFVNLGNLRWGDEVIMHAWDQDYIYEVRSVDEWVSPGDIRLLEKHEELPWLTLVTCKGYDEKSNSYRWRTVIRAVQVKVK